VWNEELVEPCYHRMKGGESVACVLTSMEQGRTFQRGTYETKVPSGDASCQLPLHQGVPQTVPALLLVCAGPVMGSTSIRVASYFPFDVTCYLNGLAFVAQELTRACRRFRAADDALLAASNAAALQAAAERLSAAILQRRCNPGCAV
jgi:hypothetical protein